MYRVSIEFYIIIQVILAFWLVLAFDLLKDRRTIDVIISKFFPLCFEMAVMVSREPLLCLEFNKPNRQNVYEINLFKTLNFSQSQSNCWHSDCLEWNIKTTS